MTRWLLALLLTGCASLPPRARTVPPGDVRAAVAHWTAAGFPLGRCAELPDALRVVVVQSTVELCSRDVYACRVGRSTGLFGWGGSYVLLVMRADLAGPSLFAHELTHAIVQCSGVANRGHSWPAGVWGMDGVEGAIRGWR